MSQILRYEAGSDVPNVLMTDMEERMSRKRYTPEQIINMLRESYALRL